MSGLVVHPLDDAEGLLREYRALLATAPDELTCWAVMRKAPPLPFLPPEWHGREVLIFAMCHTGEPAEAERDMAGLRALGRPIADVVGPHAFTGWQAAFDPLLTPGARNYWKSHDFAELSDDDDRHPRRCGAAAARAGMRDLCLSRRRCRRPRAAGGHRVPAAACAFRHERAHSLARPGDGRRLRRVGQAGVRRGRAASPRHRLRQLHAERRGSAGARASTGQAIAGWPKSSGATIRPTCSG